MIEVVVVEIEESGGQGQNRTADTGIFSPLLYRLSYLASRDFALALRTRTDPAIASRIFNREPAQKSTGFRRNTGFRLNARAEACDPAMLRVQGSELH